MLALALWSALSLVLTGTTLITLRGDLQVSRCPSCLSAFLSVITLALLSQTYQAAEAALTL